MKERVKNLISSKTLVRLQAGINLHALKLLIVCRFKNYILVFLICFK